MDTATRVQILDEADCISRSTNTFVKGMNPTMGKLWDSPGSLALVRKLV